MRTRSLELDLAHPTLEFGMGVPIYFFAGPLCCRERAPMVYSFNLDHHRPCRTHTISMQSKSSRNLAAINLAMVTGYVLLSDCTQRADTELETELRSTHVSSKVS